jgi:hypothetical protein
MVVTWRQLRGLNDLEFRVRNSLLGYRGSIYMRWRPTLLNAGGWEEARARHVPTHDNGHVEVMEACDVRREDMGGMRDKSSIITPQ